MTPYDEVNFDPPAPIGYVALRNESLDIEWLDVPMLLDTGADITLVPQQSVVQLGLTVEPDIEYELMGFDGTVSKAYAVRLTLIFARRKFRGQFLLVDQAWGILGRNILNNVPLLLDGPDLKWREYRPQ